MTASTTNPKAPAPDSSSTPTSGRGQLSGRFGLKLRALRKEAEITLESLASQTGINIGTLSLIEQGKKRPPELVPHVANIARHCGLAESSPEYQAFAELAQEERFPLRRKKVIRARSRRRIVTPRTVDEPAVLPQTTEILRALATALDRAGNRRVLRVMLRLDDGKKVVVPIGNQEALVKDAGQG